MRDLFADYLALRRQDLREEMLKPVVDFRSVTDIREEIAMLVSGAMDPRERWVMDGIAEAIFGLDNGAA